MSNFIPSWAYFVQVCELLQVLGSLMRQFLPPAGIFSALENAALLNQGSGRGWRAMRPEMPQPGKISKVCFVNWLRFVQAVCRYFWNRGVP